MYRGGNMNILFICTGNTCRSPMAEGLMKDLAKKKNIDIKVDSAGLFAFEGQLASKEAVLVMEEEGIDISNHRAKMVNKSLLESADLILTMSISHKRQLLREYGFIKNKVYTLKEYAYGSKEDIQDPFGQSINAYINAKNEIKESIIKVLEKIETEN